MSGLTTKVDANDHVRLIYGFVNKYRKRGEEFDELCSVCFPALKKAATTFDSEKGTFSTYAYGAMRFALMTWRRDSLQYRLLTKTYIGKVWVNNFSELAEQTLRECITRGYDIGDEIAQIDYTQTMANRILRVLPYKWREIVVANIMEGETYETLSKRYGVTKSRIGQIIEKAIQRMQRYSVGISTEEYV